MAICSLCQAVDKSSPCARCMERVTAQAELVADTMPRRQRVLDIPVGRRCGAELSLSFIAPAHTHFDLGYALVGEYEEIQSGRGNELPRLHGPWDALDHQGRAYRGIGSGGEFGQRRALGVIRFVPLQPGPPWPLVPPTGTLKLVALGADGPLLETEVDVPPPAPWEA